MTAARHIAFVCPRFADGATAGGAETLLRNLASHAARAGRQITFLTTCARNHFTWANEVSPGARRIDGLDVRFFPVDEDRDVTSFLRVQSSICARRTVSPEEEMLWLKNSVNSRTLCEHLQTQEGEYDRIVMGPYLFGLIYFAARIHPARTLLVPCLHDEPFAALRAMHELFTGVGGFMFNSEPERDLAHRLYGIDLRHAAVVGMGLDPFAADPAACPRAQALKQPYLVYSGRREPLKGTPLLLDYMQAFRSRTGRDLKLVFTGSGPLNVPPDLAPHVLDLGFVSEAEKHAAMAGALAFCHPSVNESFSIVILEAWLAGTAVLVHAGSEVTRYHCRQCNGGLWFRNYPEFEQELLLLLDQPQLRAQLAANGNAYVHREYSWSVIERKLFAALDAAP